MFTALSALSLLLCLATVALWVRSYQACDYVYLLQGRGGVTTSRGQLYIWGSGSRFSVWSSDDLSTRKLVPEERLLFRDSNPAFALYLDEPHFMGFAPPFRAGRHWRLAAFPHWFLTLIFAILPTGWFIGWHRHRRTNRRQRLGLCPRCGYDLRASPERCPECGLASERINATAEAPRAPSCAE